MRKLISSGSSFESSIGYSRAVADGDWLFVSGTTGFDYATMEISGDVTVQAEQTFRNIEAAMQQAGFNLADTVRVHYLLPNAADFEKCWPVLKKYLGEIRPAATMFVAGLADPRMKIEIEVTAKRQTR
jgi:enamine deaminase RidA (YjgF/YER057c/UK114 family)